MAQSLNTVVVGVYKFESSVTYVADLETILDERLYR